MTIKLDPRPARMLTSRECAKILGSMIGGLIADAEPGAVKIALQWHLENYDQTSEVIGMLGGLK